MTSIGCRRNWTRSSLELVQKARLGLGYHSEAIVSKRCVTRSDSGLTWEADPRHAEVAVAELGLDSRRRVHRRAQAASSREHHLTTRNWSVTGKKPATTCQQDWHIWHQTDPTPHSLARNAAAQSGKQHVLTSHLWNVSDDTHSTRHVPCGSSRCRTKRAS